MAVQLANALYAVWLRISYIVQAALRSVGAAGGGWALLAVLRAIGCLAKAFRGRYRVPTFTETSRMFPVSIGGFAKTLYPP